MYATACGCDFVKNSGVSWECDSFDVWSSLAMDL